MIDWYEVARRLAHLGYQMSEGDDVLEELFSLLREYEFVDDVDEWVYDEV